MTQIPNNRTGRMNVLIPLIQAKLNATFLLLHRFLLRWLNGRPVFLTLNRVPVNYGISNQRLNTDSEAIIKIQVRRERISSFGRSSYNTNVAALADLRRTIGFTNQIQQRTVSIQSDLLELLDLPYYTYPTTHSTAAPAGYADHTTSLRTVRCMHLHGLRCKSVHLRLPPWTSIPTGTQDHPYLI
jgi:hypothetical protein